jgi:serine protease inhibitor ecotin
MYKMMIFLKKTENEPLRNHFKSELLSSLREISGQDIQIAKVEGSLLTTEKFEYYCEITAESKDQIDKMLATPKGKRLSREISAYVNELVIFYANYKS